MLQHTQVSPHVHLFTAKGALLNATVLSTDKGLVAIDSLHLPRDSKELADWIHLHNGQLSYLLNTHWHSDHCYGNRYLKQQDTIVIAHELCQQTLQAERALLRSHIKQEIDKSTVENPDWQFSEALMLPDYGVQMYHTPGHSPDMISVFLPDEGILLAGDNVLNSNGDLIAIPYFYWGDATQMLHSLNWMDQQDWDVLIPGHGKPVGHDKLKQDIVYLTNLLAKVENWLIDIPKEQQSIEQLQIDIPTSACLPGTKEADFWVPSMHQFNLKRLLANAMDKKRTC